jgi:ribosomal-protein-alanine N-acetyltransferase
MRNESPKLPEDFVFPKVQPVIETERLVLRPFTLSDAKQLQLWVGDFEIADTTLNIPHPYPDGAAEEFISLRPAKYSAGEAASFAITLKTDGLFIGSVGINVTKQLFRAELGYWIAKPYWNCGYATEATQAIVQFGLNTAGLHKIIAQYFSRNPASGRVLQKAGLKQEGLLRDHIIRWNRFEDVVTCAIIRA